MALSSWLGFGKKKTPTDADSLSDSKPAASADTDDYVVIERRPNRGDNMYPMLGPGGSSVSLPYQVQPIPGITGTAGLPINTDIHPSNPLDDVPFKLSSLLSGGTCDWSRNDAAHFKSVMSRAIHHNETVYKYDFSGEESIMRESGQTSPNVG